MPASEPARTVSDAASGAMIISEVATQLRSALTPLTGADWSTPARDLDWTCRETAAHIADSFFAQAAQVVARPRHDWVPAEVRTDPAAEPEQVLRAVDACAGLLRIAVATADPELRAWHPHGAADLSGWVAMATVDGLVHAFDISAALGRDWRPPAELAGFAVERLFPSRPDHVDPVAQLLWCTGRIALPDHPRQPEWTWDPSVR
ncbi:maleylpyruvate isomerase N-terminal domain-containing protein [Microlunatus speluncae]|uniref:maleylpyruvate isomerase N-terminal domain-containing protein n=1 Tax=Microlunatus speluncae TaxID=2594267 RepID=UPI0012667FEB|nr:maleylpyruvate isomerase N-terminal domain-containing protein [Microlunatus speluncae]